MQIKNKIKSSKLKAQSSKEKTAAFSFLLLTAYLLLLPIGEVFANPQSAIRNQQSNSSYPVRRLTSSNTIDSYPEFSPDGKQIVFTSRPIDSNYYKDTQLWIMDSDGKNRRQITSERALHLYPTFTTDGKKIIFVSDRGESRFLDIWSINIDGSGITRLTNDKEMKFNPLATNDGKDIIFIKMKGAIASVWKMALDSKNQRRLTSGGNGDFFPSLCPDKNKIIFTSSRLSNGEVWTIDVKENLYERLTFNDSIESAPSCSPDGAKIAYFSTEPDVFLKNRRGFGYRYKSKRTPGEETFISLWLMDRNGTNRRRLTTRNILYKDKSSILEFMNSLIKKPNYYHISWHPDGSKIAFTTMDQRKKGSYITILELDKERLSKLSTVEDPILDYSMTGEIELTKGGWDDFGPSFSPDGTTIAFSSNRSGNWDIWEIRVASCELRVAGCEPVQLTKSSVDELAPVFSPNGKEIAYLKNSQSAIRNPQYYSLWIMKGDGSKAKQIVKDIPVLSYPVWSPDGKYIFLVSEDEKGTGIWTYSIVQHTLKRIATIKDTLSFGSMLNMGPDKQGGSDSPVYDWQPEQKKHPLAKVAGGIYPFKKFLYRIDYSQATNRIVFESNRSGDVDIWTMDVDGANLTRITKGEKAQWNPVFSLDGKKIAYATEKLDKQSTRSTGQVDYPFHDTEWTDYDIWIADVETGESIQLTGAEQIDWNPAWSPDGKRIAYVTNRSGDFKHFSLWMLFVK